MTVSRKQRSSIANAFDSVKCWHPAGGKLKGVALLQGQCAGQGWIGQRICRYYSYCFFLNFFVSSYIIYVFLFDTFYHGCIISYVHVYVYILRYKQVHTFKNIYLNIYSIYIYIVVCVYVCGFEISSMVHGHNYIWPLELSILILMEVISTRFWGNLTGTLTKINIEPKNDGLEVDFPFQRRVFSGSMLILPRCMSCLFFWVAMEAERIDEN